MTTRICKLCSKEKDLLEFRVITKRAKKYRSWTCKSCRYSQINRDKIRDYDREWKKEYRKTHKKTKEDRRLEYLRGRDRQLEYHRDYYDKNKNQILEYGKKYRKTPIGKKKLRDAAHKYEAIKREVFVEYVDRDVVFRRDKGICHICKLPVDSTWHLEHIVPLSRGGTHCYDNVAVSHAGCNVSKKNKTLVEYLEYQERIKNGSNKPKRP